MVGCLVEMQRSGVAMKGRARRTVDDMECLSFSLVLASKIQTAYAQKISHQVMCRPCTLYVNARMRDRKIADSTSGRWLFFFIAATKMSSD